MLEFKPTDHSYYCSESNYYVNGHENWGRSDYETWADFKNDWFLNDGTLDDDYNHLFRYDIKKVYDYDADTETDDLCLWLFFILQRKGIFRPVCIARITEQDMEEIKPFLSARWEYMKSQWAELQ